MSLLSLSHLSAFVLRELSTACRVDPPRPKITLRAEHLPPMLAGEWYPIQLCLQLLDEVNNGYFA
jgi:hypothetical protein